MQFFFSCAFIFGWFYFIKIVFDFRNYCNRNNIYIDLIKIVFFSFLNYVSFVIFANNLYFYCLQKQFIIVIITGPPQYKRNMSVPGTTLSDVKLEESNVLKKVASLTLDKLTLETKITKPKFVPEKLDFQLYEKFEGNQLIYSLFIL